MHSAVLGVGELLRPGEIRLSPGETYRSPEAVFVWSADGMDGLSARLHTHLRARAGHPCSPRPVVLNTWEAVYFDHDTDRPRALADRAAEVGVERFVLDDGWFRGRRNDAVGLGDWTVDPAVWPDGLRPLSDHVHGLGMQFGLWVEPEMVNLDSDLVRAHPDWVLAPSAGVSLPWRHQYVLDLANADAWAYLLDHLDRLVGDNAVDYLKWDHNRDLHEAVTRAAGADRPGVHAQTAALYSLVDTLRSRHPALEIESCASGGARVDLGILARTDRIWASDCNDPVERQQIQRWTGLLVPPELVGTHVGPEEAHTTHRSTYLSFRLATALFGHAGIEWDLTRSTREELDAITRWISLHRELRPLLHSGLIVRADLPDDATLLHGVVSGDRREAVFCWARVATSGAAHAGRVRFPGLDPHRTYVVRVLDDLGPVATHEVEEPAWFAAGGLEVPGTVLTTAGVPLPTLNPAQAVVLHLTPS